MRPLDASEDWKADGAGEDLKAQVILLNPDPDQNLRVVFLGPRDPCLSRYVSAQRQAASPRTTRHIVQFVILAKVKMDPSLRWDDG
jgi:hypothetical protein